MPLILGPGGSEDICSLYIEREREKEKETERGLTLMCKMQTRLHVNSISLHVVAHRNILSIALDVIDVFPGFA